MSLIEALSLTLIPMFIVTHLDSFVARERREAQAIDLAQRRAKEVNWALTAGYRLGLIKGEERARKELTPERYTIGEWRFAMRSGRVPLSQQ